MAGSRGGRRVPDNKARPVAGPGKLSQRSDLSQPPPGQGVYAPSGGPYGQRQRLEQAQQVRPVPAMRQSPPAAPAPGGASQATPGQIPTLAQILARPTIRPDEPPTAGLRGGPGPGPEILPTDLRPQTPSVSALLQQAAATTGIPALQELAQRAQAYGQ